MDTQLQLWGFPMTFLITHKTLNTVLSISQVNAKLHPNRTIILSSLGVNASLLHQCDEKPIDYLPKGSRLQLKVFDGLTRNDSCNCEGRYRRYCARAARRLYSRPRESR